MEINFTDYERVQRFKSNEMGDEEKDKFLKDVEVDSVLKEYLQFEDDLFIALHRQEADDVFAKMGLSEEELFGNIDDRVPLASTISEPANADKQVGKLVKMKKPFAWQWMAAACVALFIVSAVTYYAGQPDSIISPVVAIEDTLNHIDSSQKNNNTIAQENPPDTVMPKVNVPAFKNKKEQAAYNSSLAKASYEKDDLPSKADQPPLTTKFLQDFDDDNKELVQQTDPEKLVEITMRSSRGIKDASKENEAAIIRQHVHYYKGLSFLESNNYKQALSNLQWVADSAINDVYKVKANWYLALVYLGMNDAENAKILLEKVQKNNAEKSFAIKAAELLKKLK